MKVLILSQFFRAEDGQNPNRIFQMGQAFASRGNSVTVISGNSLLGLPLGGKKIGLLQKDGLAIIAFNIPYSEQMNRLQKWRALQTFARRAALQGRRLPRPDLIIASIPPLTAANAAVTLSRHHSAPLALEIREIWPDALIQRGTLSNQAIISLARRWEHKAYTSASKIMAVSPEIADLLRVKQGIPGPIEILLSEELTGDEFETIWGGGNRVDRLRRKKG